MNLDADSLITAIYLGAAGLCAIAALVVGRRDERSWIEVGAWLLLAGGLTAVVVLDILGVQQTAAAVGREAARSEGWYWNRREVQAAVVCCLGLAFGAVVVLALVLLRRHRIRNSVAAAVILGCFLAVRAVSFHYVDRVLYGELFGGLEPNDIAEATLALLVGLTALQALLRSERGLDGWREVR